MKFFPSAEISHYTVSWLEIITLYNCQHHNIIKSGLNNFKTKFLKQPISHILLYYFSLHTIAAAYGTVLHIILQ